MDLVVHLIIYLYAASCGMTIRLAAAVKSSHEQRTFYVKTGFKESCGSEPFTKLLHLHNLSWTGKFNSDQLHIIFYVTPRQPEVKSKRPKSLHNTNTTYNNLLFINNI